MSDIKLLTLNGGSLAISFTDIEVILKIILLMVSIGYTLYRWYLLKKNKND